MPLSTVLTLHATTDTTLPNTMGHLAHAAFLALLDAAAPEVAEAVHGKGENKPFAVSPLTVHREPCPVGREGDTRGASRTAGRGRSVHGSRFTVHDRAVALAAGQECRLRISFLDDALFRPFSEAILTLGQPTIRLSKAELLIARVTCVGSDEEPEARYETYEQLVNRLPCTVDRAPCTAYREPCDADAHSVHGSRSTVHEQLSFRFTSPTAFRVRMAGGERVNWPLPDPVRCVRSWVRRWNEFSGFPFEEDELCAKVEGGVGLARHDLRTRMLEFPRGRELGFVGEVDWHLTKHALADEPFLRQLHTLARFAFYCGTGIKTAMGMGTTVCRAP
ncbi:MAG: hypothetical protein CO096_25635 [Armatimonadetes bacterium CG_4_9_14_3_um_filter_66_14]|nr:MAG: hypothetical protein CO096_25635 [Armatimonadetes bacterium CG_4_9_14_3_um_filter_66_14]